MSSAANVSTRSSVNRAVGPLIVSAEPTFPARVSTGTATAETPTSRSPIRLPNLSLPPDAEPYVPAAPHRRQRPRHWLWPLAGLTGREKEVCLRILSGFSSEAIAAELGISLHSALTYRKPRWTASL